MALVEAQPAYKIYAFDRGWRIINYVTRHLFKRTDTAARWWFNRGRSVLVWGRAKGNFALYWAYVVMVGMALAGGFQYASAMLLAGLFIVIQSLLLSLWVCFSMVGIGLLAGCTFVYGRFYRIFFRCPDCHQEMDIPTFICPTCASEHTRLWPSIYGILLHRCKTCGTKLPTLRLNIERLHMIERDKLVRICPRCRVELNAGIGTGTNVHIPIIGGPSTGKSNYIVMATREFKNLYERLYSHTITFTDSKHEQDYNESVHRLSLGRELLKTSDMVGRAYNLKIQPPKSSVPKLAYIYDVAGDVYLSSQDTQMQEYYKFIDGILFVIDPFAITDYAYAHQSEISRYKSLIRPGALDVMQTYERMFQMFEASVGLHRGKRFPHPLAVVVTKIDALNLDQEIGVGAARNLILQRPGLTEEEATNGLVRDFLFRNGLDHFVRDAEMQFSRVRYFSCSALGRMPDPMNSSPFTPVNVANPLIWLLTSARAITPPSAQKVTVPPPELQIMPPIQRQTRQLS